MKKRFLKRNKMANKLVVSDPQFLKGEPVFAGTHVLVNDVMEWLHVNFDRYIALFYACYAAFPELTDEQVQFAINLKKAFVNVIG